MALSINQFKSGVTILLDNEVFQIIDAQHVKPAKGSAFVRIKIRNLKTSAVLDRTFRGQDKAEEAYVEQRKMQFLYFQNDIYHFMTQDNYEQLAISKDNIGENEKFLKDNIEVIGVFYKHQLLNIIMPNFVELAVIETEPGVRGDTVKAGTKPAKVETGAIIQVPLFVNEGDKIKIDTRQGSYVERVY